MSGRVLPKDHRQASAWRTESSLPGHLLRVQEEERKRISRELHDETGQALMLLRLQLGMLAAEVQGRDLQLKIEQLTELLDRTIAGLRRVIGKLSPRALEELGLTAALRREARELSKNTGINVQLCLPDELGVLIPEIELTVYRCVQEAFSNIAKHSRARNVTLRIRRQEQNLILIIEDDGVGIPTKAQATKRGFGLFGIKERVAGVGGRVRIHSGNDSGTQIRIILPTADVPPSARPGTRREHSIKHTLVRAG